MAYNSSSAADRLSAVRDAIANCLLSQAHDIEGRRQQMADLRALREMEKELMHEASNPSSMASLASQVRPT